MRASARQGRELHVHIYAPNTVNARASKANFTSHRTPSEYQDMIEIACVWECYLYNAIDHISRENNPRKSISRKESSSKDSNKLRTWRSGGFA